MKIDSIKPHTSPTGWIAYTTVSRGSHDEVRYAYNPLVCDLDGGSADNGSEIRDIIIDEYEPCMRYCEWGSVHWVINILPEESWIDAEIKTCEHRISGINYTIDILNKLRESLYPPVNEPDLWSRVQSM